MKPRLCLVATLVLCCGTFLPAQEPPNPAEAPSAFLREQASCPVQWQRWGEATLARAEKENRPIYVFIGFYQSELSRTTRAQTFGNPEVAKYLNENFTCVLVDREEQPEVAAAAQHFLKIVKQTEGWPAHLWLTPDGRPYEGDSYLPPTEEWGRRGFAKVARQAAETWTANADGCRAIASEALQRMAWPAPEELPPVDAAALRERLAALAAESRAADPAGAEAHPPSLRQPDAEWIRFLLRLSPADCDYALHLLRLIANSAVHDPLDGGFFRHASDAAGRLPYLQRTAQDQARLVLAFLDARQREPDPLFDRAARGAIQFTLRRFWRPGAGLAAAEDATGEVGAAYFTWTEAEIDGVLGSDSAEFKQAYAVTMAGNVPADDDPGGKFRGRNFLFRASGAGGRAAEDHLARCAARLLEARNRRPAPGIDERATAGAHGLLLAALSRAAIELQEPSWLETADQVYTELTTQFASADGNRLLRLRGSSFAATPADLASIALGCREYSKARRHPESGLFADRLLKHLVAQHLDRANGHFWATPSGADPRLFIRPRAIVDQPSAESLALLAGLSGDEEGMVRRRLAATVLSGDPVRGDTLLPLVP